jgi:hypothetical protein
MNPGGLYDDEPTLDGVELPRPAAAPPEPLLPVPGEDEPTLDGFELPVLDPVTGTWSLPGRRRV